MKADHSSTAARRTTDFLIPFLTVLGDILAVGGSFLLSYVIRFHTPLIDALGFPAEELPAMDAYLRGAVAITLAWLLLFQSRKMYGARRNVVYIDEAVNVVKVVTLGMLIVMSAGFLYRGFSYSRVVVALFWVLAIMFVSLSRGLVLALERSSYRRGRNLQDTVVIGNDGQAEQVYLKLNRHPSFGFRILGYFADEPAGKELTLAQAPHLGPFADVAPFLQSHGVELAFIALRAHDNRALFDLVTRCEGLNVEFMMVPDVLEILTSRARIRELEGIPFIRVKGIPLTMWGQISKRAFDLIAASLLIVLLSPLLLVLAIAVKVTSRGPVLYRQQRVGLFGEEFTMYKFRSMVVNADRMDGTAGVQVTADPRRGIGARNDPRRTAIGKLLRATSLDELPQLFNVITGDMSLVGPRPERPHFVKELQAVVPKYLDRHRVRSGMTGWAQVNGLRGDTSILERIKYDLYYVENWSLTFDFKILLRTLREAVSAREAHDR